MKRFKIFVVLFLGLAAAGGAGCSSDPDTTLGVEFVADSLIVSRPGEVTQDTILITAGDTVFTVTANALSEQSTLILGRNNGYENWPVLKFDFAAAPVNPVLSAELILRVATSQTDTLDARFRELLDPYSEDDTLTTLNLGPVIPDDVGGLERAITKVGLETYTLPAQLVEDWINGTTLHNGIAVVLTDTTTTLDLILGSRENADFAPRLKVVYQNSDVINLAPTDDGTFVQATTSTPNLLISDGLVRRSLIPVPIDSISENTLIHHARLLLYIVPASELGGDFTVTLYAPNSSDVSDPGILTGTLVTAQILDPASGVADFGIRIILEKFISGEIENNGLVIQFTTEGTGIRQMEFYPSAAADTLKPQIQITISDSPTFP